MLFRSITVDVVPAKSRISVDIVATVRTQLSDLSALTFRTDDIEAFKAHLSANGIKYADYGTAFAAEWHQIFFYDPEGNIIEVHQQVM